MFNFQCSQDVIIIRKHESKHSLRWTEILSRVSSVLFPMVAVMRFRFSATLHWIISNGKLYCGKQNPSMNCHLIVGEEFVCHYDPRSYVVGDIFFGWVSQGKLVVGDPFNKENQGGCFPAQIRETSTLEPGLGRELVCKCLVAGPPPMGLDWA